MKRNRMAMLIMVVLSGPVMADDAEIMSAEANGSDGAWSVSVTLRHNDTGWDNYADGWRVVLSDGTVLGTRELLHPHVGEQPFTRSLSGIAIPAETTEVFVEARTNTDGWGTARLALPLK